MLGVWLGVGDGRVDEVGLGMVGVWEGWSVLVSGTAVTVGLKVMPTIGSSSLRQEVNTMVID